MVDRFYHVIETFHQAKVLKGAGVCRRLWRTKGDSETMPPGAKGPELETGDGTGGYILLPPTLLLPSPPPSSWAPCLHSHKVQSSPVPLNIPSGTAPRPRWSSLPPPPSPLTELIHRDLTFPAGRNMYESEYQR